MRRDELICEMVDRLHEALDERLTAVVLYGAAAHGDHYRDVGDLNLLVVADDLDPGTLSALGRPVRWWLRRGQPWPRLFTAALIGDAVDVYPVELLDIALHHRVLHGVDPFAGLALDRAHLRLQCERELREKLMRLHEGYIECRGRRRPLTRLLEASYQSLAPVWRACLYLLDAAPPARDREAAAALCERLGIDRAPFDQVAGLAAGAGRADRALFARYRSGLADMVAHVDGLLAPARAGQGVTS